MAELTPQERLQPSLLDRLTDDDPKNKQESRDKRIMSVQKLRELVLRDLSWLLNTTNLEVGEPLDDYPEVRHSVLNYGIPELSGRTITTIGTLDIERQLKQAIIDFEPRILPHTLQLRTLIDETEMNQSALSFEVEGDLWARPIPQQLFLKTEVDLELGDVKVIEK